MATLKSEGKCIYCQKTYTKAGISRHLTAHLKKVAQENKTTSKAYHVKVTAGGMFLHLLVDSKRTLYDIDHFLKAIWLECCGHMSSFEIKNKHYHTDWDSYEIGEDKAKKVGAIFEKGLQLKYEYDFGSTTQLAIAVTNTYNIKVNGGILLLSRNEPLPILCHICREKPAVDICGVHLYEGNGFLCKSCSKKHEKTCEDFEDYAHMPVVNSPRMGVCAYHGGHIDTDRDGVWQGV